jgi:carbonic anhydrase
MIEHMIERGIDKKLIDMISYSGVDFDAWLSGFESVEQSVRNNVAMLKAHPLIPEDVRIEGFVIDSETGELTPVEEIL